MKNKIIIIGDIHLGAKGDDIGLFEKLIFNHVLPNCDNSTTLIFTGDQFDNKYSATTILISKVVKLFSHISRQVKECHFIVGNHDAWKYKESMEFNMSNIFSLIPNFHVHHDDIVDINGHSFHFLSFNYNNENIKNNITSKEAEYLVLHEDIECFMYDSHRRITSGIPFDLFSKYKAVFNGHIHKKQTIENVYNVGAPYQLRFNDVGNICGIHMLDVDTNDVVFIENTSYNKYIKLTYDEFTKTNKSELSNVNLWVTDVVDTNLVEQELSDISPSMLRIGHKKVNSMDGSETFIYDHHDDNIDIFEYLESINEIPITNGVIELDKKIRQRLTKLDNEL